MIVASAEHTARRKRRGRAQDGFALIIVLWAVVILALLFSRLVTDARREAKLGNALRGEAVARASGDAVLSEAILEILRGGPANAGTHRFGNARVLINIVNLSGRVNPNLASVSLMASLLVQLGVQPEAAESLAAAIVDWRTPGLAPGPHGAKAEAYRAAGLPYAPPGRPFESVDELGYVIGMTPALLAAMRSHVTLWSNSEPDPNFADPVVLGALRAAGTPPVEAASTKARVIAVTALAALPDAPRVTRRAVVQFGVSSDGRAWRILAWDDGDT